MTAQTSAAELDSGRLPGPPTFIAPEEPARIVGTRLPPLPDPPGLARMGAAEVRRCFLLQKLFEPDRIRVYHTDLDRATVGGAVPASGPLALLPPAEYASDCFAERRELGVFNIGGPGIMRVDGVPCALADRDALYIGRGSREIVFASEDATRPALFYFVSYPAHARYETRRVCRNEATASTLGSAAGANRRTIRKYIQPGLVETCQLTMGLTDLDKGSVWNSMPAHRHPRRSEIYFYFGLPADGVVLHLFGEPHETRHVVVRDRQAVLSPEWSMHAGVGTGRYSFIWAMGGENRLFDDMDGIPMEELA